MFRVSTTVISTLFSLFRWRGKSLNINIDVVSCSFSQRGSRHKLTMRTILGWEKLEFINIAITIVTRSWSRGRKSPVNVNFFLILVKATWGRNMRSIWTHQMWMRRMEQQTLTWYFVAAKICIFFRRFVIRRFFILLRCLPFLQVQIYMEMTILYPSQNEKALRLIFAISPARPTALKSDLDGYVEGWTMEWNKILLRS